MAVRTEQFTEWGSSGKLVEDGCLSSRLGSAEPGVLPADGDIVVVSAKSYVVTDVVTHLYRLVRTQGDRRCDANAGACLVSSGIRYATQAGNAAEPKIPVQ
jgi:hypothetical protein